MPSRSVTSLNLDRADLEALHRGGFLHDMANRDSDRILLKKGRLTAREHALMQRHAAIGEELCRTVRSFDAVRGIVRHHHERLDGRGYPDRLAGDAIPLLAQIVTVVDVYDALTSDRPYRRRSRPPQPSKRCGRSRERGRIRRIVERFASLLPDIVNEQTDCRREPAGRTPPMVSDRRGDGIGSLAPLKRSPKSRTARSRANVRDVSRAATFTQARATVIGTAARQLRVIRSTTRCSASSRSKGPVNR